MTSEKTRWVFDEDFSDADFGPSSTDKTFGANNSVGEFTESLAGGDNDATRMIGNDQGDKTVILSAATEDKIQMNVGFDEEIDPVVGWLVILKGPGKGNSISIGHGMNLIGRNNDQRLSLPFGDLLISGEDHAKIMYEDREFYIAHGSGKNITKVNGKMVPNMVRLHNHALIQLTKATTLAFVGLCGDDFDWSDITASGNQD